MRFRSFLAIQTGKFSRWFLRTFTKGGSSLPGKLALAIDPAVLSALAEDYQTVIITGTNGKTLTTALTYQVLKQAFGAVLTNPTGSNMNQGIVSAFLAHAQQVPAGTPKYAVLEVDEASLIHVTKYIKPVAIVTTNIFRDQMDRFGEIYTIYQKILDGVAQAPQATVIANGDSPIFNSVAIANPKQYFGFNHVPDGDTAAHYNTDGVLCPVCHKVLRYRFVTYSNLGKYYCPHCAFKRPELTYQVTAVDELTLQHARFAIDGHPFEIPVAGLYNVYNALAAYSVGRFFNLSAETIQQGFAKAQRVFGRQEQFTIDDKTVTLNLIKNPVGLNQVLDLLALEKEPATLVSLLNDNPADGEDVSWIWDGRYEELTQLSIPQVIVGGIRRDELHLRLTVAGFAADRLTVVEPLEEVVSAIKAAPTAHVNILATYTAVLQLRKVLANLGYLKEGME